MSTSKNNSKSVNKSSKPLNASQSLELNTVSFTTTIFDRNGHVEKRFIMYAGTDQTENKTNNNTESQVVSGEDDTKQSA